MKDKVSAFDTLFTTNAICKLKILLSFLDRPMQKHLAVLIKYLELQYTIRRCQNLPGNHSSEESVSDITQILEEIKPYCNRSEQSQMESMQNTLRTFENMKQMMEMAEMLKSIMPDNTSDQIADADFSDLFQLFSFMNGGTHEQTNNESKTGMDE